MIHQGDQTQTGYGMPPLVPMYASGITDSFPPVAFKAESGLTCSIPLSRKRSRDSPSFNLPVSIPVNQNQFGTFKFLGQDISMQIYQQQMEIDRFIFQHTEKVRIEIQEIRKRNSRRMIAAAEEGIVKRLKAKEDEIMKIGKLNFALEEKVKSLNVENQIWKELAETNEATANTLRINLQLVLAQQHRLDSADNAATALIDDAESYCGSNYEEDHYQQQERKVNNPNRYNDEGEYCIGSSRLNRCCRKCGKEESCVLLLPCRHLCVCTVCASSICICPICKSTKSVGVPVNMS